MKNKCVENQCVAIISMLTFMIFLLIEFPISTSTLISVSKWLTQEKEIIIMRHSEKDKTFSIDILSAKGYLRSYLNPIWFKYNNLVPDCIYAKHSISSGDRTIETAIPFILEFQTPLITNYSRKKISTMVKEIKKSNCIRTLIIWESWEIAEIARLLTGDNNVKGWNSNPYKNHIDVYNMLWIITTQLKVYKTFDIHDTNFDSIADHISHFRPTLMSSF